MANDGNNSPQPGRKGEVNEMKTKEQRELEDAQYDAERYRDEAERLRRRENERHAEQERQRKENRQRNDPSNRLYNGDVTDFREAVNCHVAACQREITPITDDADRELSEKCNAAMREGIANANKAREIFDRITKETDARIIDELRAAGLTEWADCLASGDYSSMAI
jgi:hypothetical protein